MTVVQERIGNSPSPELTGFVESKGQEVNEWQIAFDAFKKEEARIAGEQALYFIYLAEDYELAKEMGPKLLDEKHKVRDARLALSAACADFGRGLADSMSSADFTNGNKDVQITDGILTSTEAGEHVQIITVYGDSDMLATIAEPFTHKKNGTKKPTVRLANLDEWNELLTGVLQDGYN